MSEPARLDKGLEVDRVAIDRGGRRIIENVRLALAPGETVLLKGPNGAGKTTLLRALAGLLPVAAGIVRLTGAASEDELSVAARREAAIYVGHADGVKAPMTGLEHLSYWRALYRAPAPRISAAIEAFGLSPFVTQRAGALSAGQRRRLGLARVVIAGKPIWLLDEPTASVDATSAARIMELLEAHARAGGAALIATHDRLQLGGAKSYVIEAEA